MICPNCRCHLPNTADTCYYCGAVLPEGDEKTVTAAARPWKEEYYRAYRVNTGCYAQQTPGFSGATGYATENKHFGDKETILIVALCMSLIAVLILLAALILIL